MAVPSTTGLDPVQLSGFDDSELANPFLFTLFGFLFRVCIPSFFIARGRGTCNM